MEYRLKLNIRFRYINEQSFISIFFVLVLSLFFLSLVINNVSALSDVEIITLAAIPKDIVFNMVGFSGLTTFNGSNLYIVTGNTDHSSHYSSTAKCEVGDYVLSGGVIKAGFGQRQIVAETSKPLADLSGWVVNAQGGTNAMLTAQAICFDNSPPH